MIDVGHLTKRFGPRTALAEVSLHLDAGESAVLVGPNGAGKTTLLRILAGLVRPTAGSVRVAGVDLSDAGSSDLRVGVRQAIGYLSHRTLLYDDLTAEQNLRFYARLYGVADAETRISALLTRIGLGTRRHDLVRTYSRGMAQRLAVARAILHRPQLLLLDEPYAGLDPLAADTLSQLLKDLSDGGSTLLLTTHSLEPAFANGRRVIMLHRGRIVHDGLWDAAFPARYRALVAEADAHVSAPVETEHGVEGGGGATEAPGTGDQSVGAQSGLSFARAVWAIVRKDLAAELQTREIVSAMLVFAVLALFIFSFALDLRGALASAAAPGVLWAILAFTGTLGLSRSLAREHQTGGMEGLMAAPIDRTGIFFGKALGTACLMGLVALILLPLTVIFFTVPMLTGSILLTTMLGIVGYAAVGTLMAAIAVNTRAREVMLPILLLPVIFPLFLAAVQTTRGLTEGATWADLVGWTRILVVYDLIGIAVSMVTFGYALEE